ncbi:MULTISPECIES: hypothetical protein [Paenibacillus]|uniref:Uncharacterized protein n=1 Tax=Paenibacillus campinasensis TaxID=66347 RepID=A0A268EVR0_9BACL|nr:MULTISPECIES: hypothetical protein [Paenibacillus]MUG68071.1 hypothetical protein [Paenibacillus campinasensis]PAD77216.1 hypothetical protein CHH67_09385 [Paenibacillus campinasensis]PAK51958.1 hypothetical protein CHH75_13060 [Paenibacillus sp. 7541]
MKPILSKAQLDYMKAKTKFEDKAKVMEKKIELARAAQNEISQEVMEELVVETGFHDAFNELTMAENALIQWSHSTIKHEKTYRDNKAEIELMYSRLNDDPKMRNRIIQLAMKIR